MLLFNEFQWSNRGNRLTRLGSTEHGGLGGIAVLSVTMSSALEILVSFELPARKILGPS